MSFLAEPTAAGRVRLSWPSSKKSRGTVLLMERVSDPPGYAALILDRATTHYEVTGLSPRQLYRLQRIELTSSDPVSSRALLLTPAINAVVRPDTDAPPITDRIAKL